MRSQNQSNPTSKSRWTGRILSGLAVLFLLWDGAIKLMALAPVAEAFTRLGYSVSLAAGIGLLELTCLAIYVIPRTSLLGAVLLTGFLGGAVATHVRVEDPLLTHTFFPIYVGTLVWAGLLLRDERVRALARQAFNPTDERLLGRPL
jgi:hypothetical protein